MVGHIIIGIVIIVIIFSALIDFDIFPLDDDDDDDIDGGAHAGGDAWALRAAMGN